MWLLKPRMLPEKITEILVFVRSTAYPFAAPTRAWFRFILAPALTVASQMSMLKHTVTRLPGGRVRVSPCDTYPGPFTSLPFLTFLPRDGRLSWPADFHRYSSVHIHHARAVRILISQHQSRGRVTELARVTAEGGNSRSSSLFSIPVPCTPAATLHRLPHSSLTILVSPPLRQEFMPVLFKPSRKVLIPGPARTSVICQISHDRDSCLPVI